MRKLCLAMLWYGLALVSGAETNSSPPASVPALRNTNAASAGLTVTKIDSDRCEGSPVSRTATFLGNVRVDDPQMKLLSEYLLATKLPRPAGKYESLIARTNVVIDFFDSDGQTNHVTGGRAVYTCDVTNHVTNEMVVVTESPVWVAPNGTVSTGDKMTWDCITRKLTIFRAGVLLPARGTNRVDLFPASSRPAPARNLH